MVKVFIDSGNAVLFINYYFVKFYNVFLLYG